MPSLILRLTALDRTLNLYDKKYKPIPLKKDPSIYLQSFYEDIEALKLNDSKLQEYAEERLKEMGLTLFNEVFPEKLQEQLWTIRDKIKTIQIESEEPWIPWEICRLKGKINGN